MLGDRIRYFRKLRGFSQEHLAALLGFPERSLGVRVAQYETGFRTPNKEILQAMADIFEVSVEALLAPACETETAFMQVLFAIEDARELVVEEQREFVTIRLRKTPALEQWAKQQALYRMAELPPDEYELWRHNYVAERK
ncbi:MAG: helix-turn-helix transcriptional regulator [Oscillospiraceae bacterium]|nr:helix-turn-helix transcriptional regulator [Oscillospiraceae bacterium]